MLRLILPVLAGAFVASAATYWTVSINRASTSSAVGVEDLSDALAAAQAAADEVIPLAARLVSARVLGDASMCEDALRRLASLPPSSARTAELEALVARCAALDAPRSVALVTKLELARSLLIAAFQSWAASDVSAALAALGTLASAADQRSVAASLLAVLGDDEASIQRIATAAPLADATSLRVEALLQRAERDPSAALEAALLSVDGTARRVALPQIGAIWAARDPYGAIAAGAAIGDQAEALAFTGSALRQWAEDNVDVFLAYVENNYDPAATSMPFVDAVRMAASLDGDGVLELADRLDGGVARVIRLAVFEALFDEAPQVALARYNELPPTTREEMRDAVASMYGQRDPDGAVAWLRSFDPPSTEAARAVLSGIARVDPVRALDIASASDSAAIRTAGAALGSSFLLPSSDSETVGRVLDRLTEMGQSRTTMLSLWARRDPQSALEWMKGNTLTPAELTLVMRPLAEAFAGRDADEALRMTATLPEALRPAWRAAVDAVRAQADPAALSTLLANASSSPGQTSAVQSALRAARANPAAALAQIESMDEAMRTLILATTLREWTGTQPLEASKWATGLGDLALREQAMRLVALAWAQDDFTAARGWVGGLEHGAARDSGLAGLLPNAALEGALDDALLAEFSSESARRDALKRALPSIGRTDPQQAQALLDRYVPDPDERRTVELEMQRVQMLLPTGPRPIPLPSPPAR